MPYMYSRRYNCELLHQIPLHHIAGSGGALSWAIPVPEGSKLGSQLGEHMMHFCGLEPHQLISLKSGNCTMSFPNWEPSLLFAWAWCTPLAGSQLTGTSSLWSTLQSWKVPAFSRGGALATHPITSIIRTSHKVTTLILCNNFVTYAYFLSHHWLTEHLARLLLKTCLTS